MLAVTNTGPFQAKAVPMSNIQGVDTLVVAIRGAFDLQGRLLPKDAQPLVVEADQFWGAPETSSLKESSDITLGKKGTDVLLRGHAYPGSASGEAGTGNLALRVGSVEKKARVYGERVWYKTWFGAKISRPKPFEKIPLKWEFCLGGMEPVATPEVKQRSEARNPVGLGFRADGKAPPPDGHPLPHFELVSQPIKSWKDLPVPCGFGPIAPHWQPRLGYAGTYDEAWQKGRAPLLPKDFDQRFFNVAPADQTTVESLVGGEPVEVLGVTKSGPLRFSLPRWRQTLSYRFANHNENAKAKLETVTIDSDASQVVLVWHASLPCDRKILQVREIKLESASFG